MDYLWIEIDLRMYSTYRKKCFPFVITLNFFYHGDLFFCLFIALILFCKFLNFDIVSSQQDIALIKFCVSSSVFTNSKPTSFVILH